MTSVSATSSATTLFSSSSSSSSSGDSSVTDLKAQITAKQAELASATTEEEKASIKDEITALKAELSKAQSDAKSQWASATSPAGPPPGNAKKNDGDADDQASQKMSGESERIGSVNFDANTPFGEQTAWV